MVVASAMSTVSGQAHNRYNLGDTGTKQRDIGGPDYNSVNDLFNNPTDYVEGQLNCKPEHDGIECKTNSPDTSGDFSFLIPLNYVTGSAQTLLTNRLSTSGLGIFIRTGGTDKVSVTLDDGTNQTLTSDTALSEGVNYVFGYQKSDGNWRLGLATSGVYDRDWET